MAGVDKLKIKAIIEQGNSGFDITLEYNESVPFGLLGQGKTVEDAKADFENSYREMVDLMNRKNIKYPSLEIEYTYSDIITFIKSVSSTFTMSGLSKITGINRKQLGHYVQGVSKPRPATAIHIQNSISAYIKELSSVRFV